MLSDTMPTLVGETVLLRPFEHGDVALVRAVADDPLIPLITTVPTSGTEADALAFIERQRDRLRSGAGYSFAIVAVRTGEPVGQIGLWLHDIGQGRATTGYWVAPHARGRGHVTAALRLVSDWALGLDEIRRLELYVEPWNEGSWRAAEACGFVREGLLRSWQEVGDEGKDMYMYSRLPEDGARVG